MSLPWLSMCAWSYYPYAYHYVVLLTLGRRMQDIGGASYVPLLISRGSSSISLTLLFTLSIPCKYLCCHQTPKRGRLKEHFPPFWVLCVWRQHYVYFYVCWCRQVQAIKNYVGSVYWFSCSEVLQVFYDRRKFRPQQAEVPPWLVQQKLLSAVLA